MNYILPLVTVGGLTWPEQSPLVTSSNTTAEDKYLSWAIERRPIETFCIVQLPCSLEIYTFNHQLIVIYH